MADTNGNGNHGRGIFSAGNMLTIASICGMGLIAWDTLQADFKALAQRVDIGDKRDEKTADNFDAVKGAVIDLRADGRAMRAEIERQGRQLDRIEGMIRNATTPTPGAPR